MGSLPSSPEVEGLKVRLSATIEPDLLARFQRRVSLDGLSASSVIEALVKWYLESSDAVDPADPVGLRSDESASLDNTVHF